MNPDEAPPEIREMNQAPSSRQERVNDTSFCLDPGEALIETLKPVINLR